MHVDMDEVYAIDSYPWSDTSYNTGIPKADFQKAIDFGAERDLVLDHTRVSPDFEDVFSSKIWKGEMIVVKGKAEVSGEVRGTISWGGSEGTKAEVSAKVEARDDNSHADVTAKVDSNGQGSVSAGAGVSKDVNTSDSNSKK